MSPVLSLKVEGQSLSRSALNLRGTVSLKLYTLTCPGSTSALATWMGAKRGKKGTCFVPDGDDGAPPDAHALGVDHRGAQESCNGAIYRRASLLQYVPEKKERRDFFWSPPFPLPLPPPLPLSDNPLQISPPTLCNDMESGHGAS